MSSFTTIGINKNKKGFIPKITKRKERHSKVATPVTKQEPITLKIETLTAEEIAINNRKRQRDSDPIQINTTVTDNEKKGLVVKVETTEQDIKEFYDDDNVSSTHEKEQTELDDEGIVTNNHPLEFDDMEFNVYEDELDEDSDYEAPKKKMKALPRSKQKKKKTTKRRAPKPVSEKPVRNSFRHVTNLRTLNDITGDLYVSDNLEKPMSTFTKDIDGIVSKTFKEMEIARDKKKKLEEAKSKMSPEELEQLEQEEKVKKLAKQEARAREKQKRLNDRLAENSGAIQVRLVDGEIVLDTDTLIVERQRHGIDTDDDDFEIIEENDMSRKINSQTYGKKENSVRWDALETDLFYKYLSQFGTDFEMLSKMFPGRTRNQIRSKFNREERWHPDKVSEHLIEKRARMDIEKYTEISGIELETVPEDFHELQL